MDRDGRKIIKINIKPMLKTRCGCSLSISTAMFLKFCENEQFNWPVKRKVALIYVSNYISYRNMLIYLSIFPPLFFDDRIKPCGDDHPLPMKYFPLLLVHFMYRKNLKQISFMQIIKSCSNQCHFLFEDLC